MKKTNSKKRPTKALRKPQPKAAKAKVLAPLNPLQRYLTQIAKHALLTAEEEHALAVSFHETKDPKAAYELTVRNLRLVVKIALDYRKAWSNTLELIQEGNIGLMNAIRRFDPYRQVRLSTYAAWWIRAYILKFIMNNWRLIKIGNTEAERKLFYRLKLEQQKLLSEGFAPKPKLLAERLNVKENDVIEMSARLGAAELSLDQPQRSDGGDGGSSRTPLLSESIPEKGQDMDDNLASSELRGLVRKTTDEFRKGLKPRERILLEKRLLADEPVTLQDIGLEWGVSRERVRQLEARLLEKLRVYFTEKHPDLVLEPKNGERRG